MNERQKQWLNYVLVVALVLMSGYFGVRYPLPDMPMEERLQLIEAQVGLGDVEMQAVGPTRFRSIQVDHDVNIDGASTSADLTCSGTVSAEQLTTTDDLTVTDDATVGGDFTVTGTASWGCSTSTIENNLYLTGTLLAEDAAITDTLDVDGATTLDDLDIDLSSSLNIDGHMLDVGTGSCSVADGDNDVCIAAVLEVDGELEADGAIDADAGLTVDGGVTNIGGGSPDVAAGDNDLYVTNDLEVDGELQLDGTVDVNASMTGEDDLEHVYFPSVVTTAITWTAAAGGNGAIATIADGEIWFVWAVFVNVTTDFDCTGDDTTLVIGDGVDPDGFVVLADAELQVADTEQTGSPAGWQGLVAATMGVYLDGAVSSAPHIYAPSGAAETIDWLLDESSGETITAGEATIYVIYTRIQ